MKREPKYPSLYADLEPAHQAGVSGQRVVCAATGAELGFVWWISTGARAVSWHYRAPDGTIGERTTERNAVQALRDRQNGTTYQQADLFDGEKPAPRVPRMQRPERPPERPAYQAERRPEPPPPPPARMAPTPPAPRPPPIVDWGSGGGAGLTDTLSKLLKGSKW